MSHKVSHKLKKNPRFVTSLRTGLSIISRVELLRWPRIRGWVGRERGIAHAVVKLSRKFWDQFQAVALARYFLF